MSVGNSGQGGDLLHLEEEYVHLGVSELRKPRSLEDARLKRLVVDLTLGKPMLAEALRKNLT